MDYIMSIHLGNVRAVVDANGDVIQQSNYYTFGGVFAKRGSVDNKYLQQNLIMACRFMVIV